MYSIFQWLFLFVMSLSVHVQPEPIVINAQTIANLEQIYTFDGECGDFHPDESVIATTYGLFNLENGEQIMAADPSGERPYFSPDGRWSVIGTTIINVQTGAVVHQTEANQRGLFMFSDNGLYAHQITGQSYSLPAWEIIETLSLPDYELFRITASLNYPFISNVRVGRDFKIGNGIPRYLSPQETYWVVVTAGLSDDIEQGIYMLETGERLDLPPEFDDPIAAALLLDMGTFMPNDSLFITHDDGSGNFTAYHLPEFEQAYTLPFDIGDENRLFFPFSDNALYFGVRDDGVYQTTTGERLFEINGHPVFSPDNRLVGTSDGLYQLPSGQQTETFSDGAQVKAFSGDAALVAVVPDGVFDLTDRVKRFEIADDIGELFFSTDSSLLYSSRAGQMVAIYDTSTGEEVFMLQGFMLTLSPDEHYLSINAEGSCHVYGIN